MKKLKKSSDFVKVVFADKKKVLRQLKDYAKKIKQTSPEIEKIGLFGSFVTDTYGPTSDVDLLIILRQSRKRFLDRIPGYVPDGLCIDCDVFPYTKAEIKRMKKENNPWMTHILKEVTWL